MIRSLPKPTIPPPPRKNTSYKSINVLKFEIGEALSVGVFSKQDLLLILDFVKHLSKPQHHDVEEFYKY